MQASHVLRLLRPLLARPARLRAGGTRLETTCDPDKKDPPCDPCVPAPQPKCRGVPATVITGKRVVCCPPPKGARPPCTTALPPCPLSCANMSQVKLSSPLPTEAPLNAIDRVAQKMRAQEEELRRQYEAEVAARKALGPDKWPQVNCKLTSTGDQSQVMATDGRSYSLVDGQPPPPTCPAPGCPPYTARTPPEPQLVQLKRPTCAAEGSDHCAHQPRKLVSIDRSAAPDPKCPDECANVQSRSKSPEPCPLPKKHCDNKKGKGLKARIMETLNRGRSASPTCGAASGSGASCGCASPTCGVASGSGASCGCASPTCGAASGSGASCGCANPTCGTASGSGASGGCASGGRSKLVSRSDKSKAIRKSIKDNSWCQNMPGPAPAPKCCTEPTVPDRLKRTPPPKCDPLIPPGKRRLHTSVAAGAAKPAAGREDTIAAAKKFEATLKERDKLNEAGRGRTVLPPVCEVALPPPPKPSGGALELGVPPGADTVCVHVSVGCGGGVAPASICARAGPPAPCGAPHPPPAPPGGGPTSDSWLSIKTLQQKLSGRQPCSAKPAESRCGPPPAPSKHKPLTKPASANPCAKQKMTDIIPKTIFIKTS